MDYEAYLKDCEYLKSLGFIKKVFFYATGGGEDENDMDIFVKGDNALTSGWQSPAKWSVGLYKKCNYIHGFDNDSSIINIYDSIRGI